METIPQCFRPRKVSEEKLEQILEGPKHTTVEEIDKAIMKNSFVGMYTKSLVDDWLDTLAKQGYDQVEIDLTVDGQWHGNIKPYGRVAFWKQKESDGIVILHVKFQHDSSTVHGTGIYAIGDARKYFKELGYKAWGTDEKIKMNNREFDSFKYFDCLEFRRFLDTLII